MKMEAKSISYNKISCRMGAESVPYNRMKHRRGAKSASYNKIRSGMATHSASYKKNVAKCKENEGKRCLEKGWKRGGEGADKGWPGGVRDGRILRFAEAGTDSAFGWSVCSLNTA